MSRRRVRGATWPPRRGPRIRGPRRGWRLGRFLGFLAGATLLAALAVGALQHRLRQGPVPLPAVAELAEAWLNADAATLGYRVGGAAFALGAPGAPSGLVLTDLSVIGPRGDILAAAPRLSMDLEVADLLAGRIRPRGLTLAGVSLTLLRRSDGSVGLMPGEASEGGAEPAAAAALLEAPDGPLSSLRRLVADEAELVLRDAITGRAWRLSDAHLEIRTEPDRHVAEARGRLSPLDAGAGLTAARLAVSGTRSRETGALSLAARFEGLALEQLATAAPELAALSVLEAAAAGEMRFAADGEGALEAFDATLRLGAGRVAGLEGPAGGFEAAEARLVWEPRRRRLRIDRLEARTAAGALAVSGAVTAWPAAADATVPGWSVSLDLERLALTEAAGFDAPLAFSRGTLEAEVLPDRARIEVSRLALGSGALALEARGALQRAPDGWTVAASFASEGFSTETLVRHWPPALAPGGRRWLVRNLRAGRVEDVEGWLWAAPGAAPEMTLDFGFAGLAAEVVPGLPPVTNAAGRGRATLRRLDLDFSAGGATAPGGGRVDLAGSRFSIPALWDDPPTGEAALAARGAIGDVLALLDEPPLGLVSRLDADVPALQGRAEIAATVTLPLLADLKLTEIGVAAEAEMTDVSGRLPGADFDVVAERLTLAADLEALRLAGPIRLAGLPARLEWVERYGGPEAPARRLGLSARLNRSSWERFGPTAVRLTEGVVELSLTLEGVERPRVSLDAGLDGAALALPELGWRKPAGTPGRLTASGAAEADGLSVERFALEAGDLSASGSAELGPNGGVRRVVLSRLALEGALDVSLALEREAGGAVEAEVGGAFVDLGAVSRRLGVAGGGAAAGGASPFVAKLEVDRVIAAPGFALHRARGQVVREGEVVRARLRGDVNGGGPALARYRDEPGAEPLLSLRTTDAGRMLADLGLGGVADGGRLQVRARLPRDGAAAATGVAEISGIRVADAAALGRVVERARAEGALEGEDPRVEGGYLFDEVRVSFSMVGSEIRVEEGLAVGPSLGVKVDGAYDRASDRLDFDGVLTPAYAINGLLNRIPVVGLLFGGEGEGLFALTFAVHGPQGAPEITVNPLSVLTPGVLRRLLQPGEAPEEEGPPDLFREMEP